MSPAASFITGASAGSALFASPPPPEFNQAAFVHRWIAADTQRALRDEVPIDVIAAFLVQIQNSSTLIAAAVERPSPYCNPTLSGACAQSQSPDCARRCSRACLPVARAPVGFFTVINLTRVVESAQPRALVAV